MAPGCSIGRHAAVCNADVEDFLAKKRQLEHRRKVEAARSDIKTGWSEKEVDKRQFLRQNVKRDQQREDRYGVIEKENHRMLHRLHSINLRPPQSALGKITAQMVLEGTERSASAPQLRKQNITPARLQELRRIDSENKRILKRIQGAKPSIDRAKLEEAHQQQQKLMRMRCEQGPRPVHAKTPALMADLARLLPDVPSTFSPLAMEQHQLIQDIACGQEDEVEDTERVDDNENAADTGNAARGSVEAPEKPHLGGAIPATSRKLADALMQEYFGEDEPPQLVQEEQEEETDWEAEAAAAKEAAQRAFRQAQAVDQSMMLEWGGLDMLNYDHVVQHSRGAAQLAPKLGTAW